METWDDKKAVSLRIDMAENARKSYARTLAKEIRDTLNFPLYGDDEVWLAGRLAQALQEYAGGLEKMIAQLQTAVLDVKARSLHPLWGAKAEDLDGKS